MKTVIMAGGKSSRLGVNREKALLSLGGATLLERSVAAVRKSEASDCLIAISNHTPRTEQFAKKRGLDIIETPGHGYHEDALFLLEHLGCFLSINVDIPFISADAINKLHLQTGEASIACVVPLSLVTFQLSEQSIFAPEEGKKFVWIGLNYVTPSPKTGYLILEDALLALNVNTLEDMSLAEKMLSRDGRFAGE